MLIFELSPFRKRHLLTLLEALDNSRLPLDTAMSHYFRANRALGSKDRYTVSQAVYMLKRWQGAIDVDLAQPITWSARVEALKNFDPKKIAQNTALSPHVRISFPKALFGMLTDSLGDEKAFEVALASNERAPLFIRTNTLKISREALLKRLQEKEDIKACFGKDGTDSIILLERVNFFSLDAFKEGLFEVQDENSQQVAELVQAKPGDKVLDYCAGSGGKALAIAPKLRESGQLFLHDIRVKALDEAKKRLKRAGIQNAQRLAPGHKQLKALKGSVDWVLVDAPCSGTGTLRRNPDLKWKFDKERFKNLLEEQRDIFEKALTYVKPGGYIVYATCSLLKEENEEQIIFFKTYFKDTYGLVLEKSIHTLPAPGEGDGFFGAVLSVAQNPAIVS